MSLDETWLWRLDLLLAERRLHRLQVERSEESVECLDLTNPLIEVPA
jgi:hypothetical protein